MNTSISTTYTCVCVYICLYLHIYSCRCNHCVAFACSVYHLSASDMESRQGVPESCVGGVCVNTCIYICIYLYVYTQLHICVHVCIPTYSSRNLSPCHSCLRDLSISLPELTTKLKTKAGTVCLCKYAFENISHTHTRSLFLSLSELTIKLRHKRALCVCVSMVTRMSLSHTLAFSLSLSLLN